MTICVKCQHCVEYGGSHFCNVHPKEGYTTQVDPVTGTRSRVSPYGTFFEEDAICAQYERCEEVNKGDCREFLPIPPRKPTRLEQTVEWAVAFLTALRKALVRN